MSSNFKKFKELHYGKQLFVLPNAWDAKSALVFQQEQFPAIGTSSAAVSGALGYDDGEGMPFNDYLFVIKRILSSVQVPVTIDMEMGYAKSNEKIYENIQKLIEAGVVGINIEDSIISNSKRSLRNANEFAETISYIRNKFVANNKELFINVRCDTYILNVQDKQKETGKRLKIYESAGADGIFLPCISNENDIAEAMQFSKLPLNVMCIPGLPDFDTLQKLGVKRISMGPFLFNKTYKKAAELSQKLIEKKTVSPIL
jgi:2-methylisocitrate lyase-like PEP mutase family enzyme